MSLLLQLMPLSEAPSHRTWLDDSERARLLGIKDAQRAAQFLAGHCLARQLAGTFSGGQPQEWSLRVAGNGQRWLDHPSRPTLAVSLSHAGRDVVAAVGTGALGVDIEPGGQARRWLALSRAMLSAPEQAAVAAASDEARAGIFLQAWTLKEAWAKRSGRGLQRDEARRCAAETDNTAQAEAWTWQLADGTNLALAAWPGADVRTLGLEADRRGWRYRNIL